MSSKLRVKVPPPAHEAGQSPAVYLFTLLVPFPPFLPHCSKTIAPCDLLFTIWTVHTWRDLQLLPLLWPSHFSHSHLCTAKWKRNKPLSVNKSIQSISEIHFDRTKQLAGHSNHKLLFFWLWLCFLLSLPWSFRLWFPSGKQNGYYLSHSALWVAVKCWCLAYNDTTGSHEHMQHCACKGNTLKTLNTYFPPAEITMDSHRGTGLDFE